MKECVLLSYYEFIIDTNKNPYSFFDAMAEYITGCVNSDCNSTSIYDMFVEEVPKEDREKITDLIQYVHHSDYDGLGVMCNTISTPGWISSESGYIKDPKANKTAFYYDNNPPILSVVIYLNNIPTEKEIIFMKDRSYLFVNNYKKIYEKLGGDGSYLKNLQITGHRLNLVEHIRKEISF